MIETLNIVLNEGVDYPLTLNVARSTVGETLSVVWREKSASGTGDVIATASGVAANTDVSVTIASSIYSEGDYLMEIWSELGESDQYLIYPTENKILTVTIQDRLRG